MPLTGAMGYPCTHFSAILGAGFWAASPWAPWVRFGLPLSPLQIGLSWMRRSANLPRALLLKTVSPSRCCLWAAKTHAACPAICLDRDQEVPLEHQPDPPADGTMALRQQPKRMVYAVVGATLTLAVLFLQLRAAPSAPQPHLGLARWAAGGPLMADIQNTTLGVSLPRLFLTCVLHSVLPVVGSIPPIGSCALQIPCCLCRSLPCLPVPTLSGPTTALV